MEFSEYEPECWYSLLFLIHPCSMLRKMSVVFFQNTKRFLDTWKRAKYVYVQDANVPALRCKFQPSRNSCWFSDSDLHVPLVWSIITLEVDKFSGKSVTLLFHLEKLEDDPMLSIAKAHAQHFRGTRKLSMCAGTVSWSAGTQQWGVEYLIGERWHLHSFTPYIHLRNAP